jgi:hypothetical protein
MYTSTFLENKILDHVLRNTPYSPPSPLYIGLYYSNPATSTVEPEVNGNNYARISSPSFSVSGSMATSNAQLFFPRADNSWGVVKYYGLKSALSGGDLLFYGRIVDPRYGDMTPPQGRLISTGDILRASTNNIVISMGGAYSTYLSENLLDFLLNGVAFSSPGLDVFAALYTTLPAADDSGGVEVSAADYSRLRISGSSWSAPANGVSYNVISLNFTSSAAEDWGTIRGICLRDDATGGNMLFRGALSPVASILEGDSYEIASGKLSTTIY